MNPISNNCQNRIYSQQSIKDGEKFLNFIKEVKQDCYKKSKEDISQDADIFSNFLKRAKADASKLKVKQYIARLLSKQVSEIEVVDLTIVSNDKSKAKSKSKSKGKAESLRNPANNQTNATQKKEPKLDLSIYDDTTQSKYFEDKSRKLLEELDKETPIIVGSEKSHVASENELKALTIIAFCDRFKIKNSHKKLLRRRIVDLGYNSEGKKISLRTAQNYVHIIKNIINKNFGIRYDLSEANVLSDSEFKKLDSIVKNELSNLKEL